MQVLEALLHNKLYINLKKCSFFTEKLFFLGYIVSVEGIHADED
jgi:hypothetical protein